MTSAADAGGLAASYAEFLARPARPVAEDLESFAALLVKWQRVQNLVSRETEGELWRRHMLDSLQVLPLLRPSDLTLLDLGSGGGFPAIPLAIAAKGGPRRFVLIEPTGRKASFLRTVARELGLSVEVHAGRAEAVNPAEIPAPDVITARALTRLHRLCGLSAPFFGPKSRAIFHKGREHVDELAESSALWHHDVLITESVVEAGGVLLELTNLRSRTAV